MVDFFYDWWSGKFVKHCMCKKGGHAHMRFYSQLHLLLIALDTKMPRRQQQKFLVTLCPSFFFYHLWSQEIIET